MKRAGQIRAGAWTSAVILVLASGEATAQSTRCTAITSVPYLIQAPGKYCLTGSLNYAGASGAAITIDSSFVTLDLNGFKLSGSAGPGTFAQGIYALEQSEITVRNGTLTGFISGILLSDDENTGYTTGGAHVVEKIRALRNTFRGLRVEGRGVLIRDNLIQETGGTTVFGDGAFAMGIEVYGPGATVLANSVQDTVAQPLGEAVGISLSSSVFGGVVESNQISNMELPQSGSSWGIWIGGDSRALLVRNRIIRMEHGLAVSSTVSGAFRETLTSGCIEPWRINSLDFVDAGRNE